MVYQLSVNPYGKYKKPDNTIVDLLKCNQAISLLGINVNWIYFATDDEAIAYFQLTKI